MLPLDDDGSLRLVKVLLQASLCATDFLNFSSRGIPGYRTKSGSPGLLSW
jgi:hypothetical protein